MVVNLVNLVTAIIIVPMDYSLTKLQPCQMSRGIAQTSSLLYLPVGYNLACWPPSLPIRLISQLSRSILSPRLLLGGFFAEKPTPPPSSSMRLALCPPQ